MIIVKHIGKRGTPGADGTDGLGVSTQAQASTSSPYTTVFAPNKISQSVTWERSTEATYQNRYNVQDTILPQTVNQVIDYTEIDETNWLDPFGNDNWSVTATGVTDPFGGAGATEVTINDTTPLGKRLTFTAIPKGVKLNEVYTISFYAQLVSGTITGCTAGLSNISATVDVDVSQLDSTWRRFTVRAASVKTNEFNLYFRTTGAVINIYRVNATEGITLQVPVFTAGSAPLGINTNSEIYRFNEKGYIIQPESTNICPYSEDLRKWTISGLSTLIANEDFDSLEADGSFTEFIVNGGTVLNREVPAVSDNTEYNLSFYAVANDGAMGEISVTLAGGESKSIVTTESYIRQTIKITSGTDSDIQFEFTNATPAASFVLAGVQLELSEPTGYIPTFDLPRSRGSDNVALSVDELPSLLSPFTFYVKWSEVDQNPIQKYLFNADDSFYAYIENAEIVVFGGGIELLRYTSTSPDNDELFIVHDGVNMTAYSGGEQKDQQAYTGETAEPAFFYIGSSDNGGSNSLDGILKSLTFWNLALTADQTKYVGEK